MQNRVSKLYLITSFILPLSIYGTESKIVDTSIENHDGKPFQFDDLSSCVDDTKLINSAYTMAPKEIHELVHALKSNLPSQAYVRPLLFTGPPGTGKTTLARILAVILNKSLKEILALEGYKKDSIKKKCELFTGNDTTFHYKYINGSELGNRYQHSKSQELKELVRSLLETKKYCILVVDEVNALFSGQKNENSTQAHETALALKHIFEQLETSKRILTIFTTNYPEQIPKKYGLRAWFLQGNVFHFDEPDRKKQKIALSYHFKKKTDLKFKIPNNKLKKFLPKLDGWSFRRIAALCDLAIEYALINKKKKKPTLCLSHLKESMRTLKKQYKILELDQEKPSEQERLCNEDLALQERFYNSQLKLSKKTSEYNRNLHNLQMVMQMRALNIARHNTSNQTMISTDHRNWGPNTITGQNLVKHGDSKKALPENLQSLVEDKRTN